MSAIINEQNKISHKAFAEYTKEHWTVLVASIPHRTVGAEQVAPAVANLVEQFAEVNDLGSIGTNGTGYRKATGNATRLVFHSHPTAKEKRDSTLVLTGTTIYKVALDNALMWCVDSDWCSMWYAQVTNDKASDEVRKEIDARRDVVKKHEKEEDAVKQVKVEEKESAVKKSDKPTKQVEKKQAGKDVAAERDRLAEENAKLKKQVASLIGTESGKVRKLNAEVKRLNEELRTVKAENDKLSDQLADAAGLSAENEELHKQVGELLDQLKSVTSTVNGFDKLKFKLDFTDDGVFVWIDDPESVLTGRIIKGVTKQGVKLWFEYFPGNDESDAKILRIAGLKSNQCRDLSKRIGAPVTWSNKLKQAWRDNPEYVEPGKVA